MIYLIGGAPRIGKSIIAKQLSETVSGELSSTDELEMPPGQLPPFYGDPAENTLTPDKRVELQIAEANLGQSIVENIIKKALQDNQTIVIEGVRVLPHHVDYYIKQFGKEKIKSIFIGSENIELILRGMEQNTNPNDWLKNANEEVRRQVAEFTKAFSGYLREETEKFRLSYKERTDNFLIDVQEVVKEIVV